MLQKDDVDLVSEIEKAIEGLRVGFQENGGELSFVRYDRGIVYVQFVGACIGYPDSPESVRAMIEAELRQSFPEVERVEGL